MANALECWFFMSYAWGDNPDKDPGASTVSAFAQYVENALASKVGPLTLERVGFLDRKELDAGQSWEERLSEALRGARSLLPLLTERYFSREACGREWGAFESRTKRHGSGSELIIPVIWDKLHRFESSLPEGLQVRLAESHFVPAELEYMKEYHRLGMSALMQRMPDDERARKTVRIVVDAITDLIVDRFRQVQLPVATSEEVRDWPALTAKFGGIEAPQPAPAPGSAALPVLHFAVAAGTLAEMDERRLNALRFYPGTDRDWIPYDAAGLSVSQVALETSRSFQLPCRWLTVTDKLVDDIRALESDGCQPVIVLVDPWSLEVASLKASLSSYDQSRFRNSAVIVAWNEDGATDSSGARARLDQDLRRVFSRSMPATGESPWFNARVTDVDGLRSALYQAVKDIRALAATELAPKRAVQSSEAPPVARNA
jgi:FxsC-like protein